MSCLQHVGKGKLVSILKDIAKFLNLPDVADYTGHAYRRTSATLLVDQGADLITLKRHGGWKSNTVAESYINESALNKQNTSKIISNAMGMKKTATITSGALLEKNVNINLNPKPATVTSGSLLNNKIQVIPVPSTSKQNLNQFTQEELEDIENITQKEYAEIVTTNFNSNQMTFTQIESEEMQSITQEVYDELLSTNFSPPKKRMKNHVNDKEEKNVFVIKNCTVNIYNK